MNQAQANNQNNNNNKTQANTHITTIQQILITNANEHNIPQKQTKHKYVYSNSKHKQTKDK